PAYSDVLVATNFHYFEGAVTRYGQEVEKTIFPTCTKNRYRAIMQKRKRTPSMATTDTRDAILDATEKLIGVLGYAKTTVDDVAKEAGVGKRTIYVYFP